MEYSVASFIPVILAAVSATALSQWAFGDVPAFQIPSLDVNVLSELPLVIGLGLLTGVLAALFIQMVQTIAAHAQPLAIGWRMLLAGLFMGLVGGIMPEVMGIGYDSVDAALLGQFGLGTLLGLILLKLLATSACIGLGVPGGMIGPVLFLGACLGSLTGLLVSRSLGVEADVGFYALLGMGAMMGASLQAPLAALTAMLELTHVPGIIMPGMLAIVVASLTASQVFKKESLFIAMLKANGLDYAASPVMQALRRVGVASVMDTGFVRVENTLSLAQAQALLAQQPEWLLVDQAGRPDLIMPAVDLARWLADQDLDESSSIDLLEIPAERSQVAAIAISATLQQAWEQLQATEAEALYVQRITAPGIERIYGVLTLNRIESAYKGP
jgi:CIC family chloride channel protein